MQASPQNSAPEAGASSASQADSTQSATAEEVLVRGRRGGEIEFDLHDFARNFIGQAVKLPQGGGYSRWHRRVCVGVNNLERSAAQFIADRVSLLAAEVGLEPGEPGCSPGVHIIFANDAKAMAANLVENEPLLFRPARSVCCMHLGVEALDDFVESDSAVRWWHVSMQVDAVTGKRAIRLPQDDRLPINSVAGPSRIHSGILDQMYRVVIIVDSTQLAETNWQQLGDYLGLISLAQIDPKADPAAYDSILNVPTNPEAYPGLTDWDRSYLRALYAFNRERTHEHQLNAIVSEMARQDRDSND